MPRLNNRGKGPQALSSVHLRGSRYATPSGKMDELDAIFSEAPSAEENAFDHDIVVIASRERARP